MNEKLINRLPALPEHVMRLRDMDGGELLGANAEYWLGPGPVDPGPGDTERTLRMKRQAGDEITRLLRRTFVPGENMISGGLDRHTHHVGGAEATWTLGADLAPARRAEVEAILRAFAANSQLHLSMQSVTRRLMRDGGASLRVRVPAGALRGGRVKTRDPVSVARALRVEVVPVENGATWEDDETLGRASICRIPQQDANPVFECAVVDAAGETVVTEFTGPTSGREIYRLQLGGRVPLVTLTAPMLIKPGTERLQGALSMGMTMLSRNTELAGFVERWMHNIEPQVDEFGQPVPIVTGPGRTMFTRDAVTTDERGIETAIGSGEYKRLEPVGSAPVEAMVAAARREFYASLHQSHYLMGADATASGASRITAMAAFEASLRPYQSQYREGLRAVLELALALVGALIGRPGAFDAEVDVRLTDRVTRPSADERRQSLEEWKAGAISHETLLADRGVTEPDAELAQINAERGPPNQTSLSGGVT